MEEINSRLLGREVNCPFIFRYYFVKLYSNTECMFRLNYLLFLPLLGLVACGQPESDDAVEVTVPEVAVAPDSASFSFQLFDVIDSAGAMHGVGYDIYNGGKRMIHQTTIPGEPGINGFVSHDEAESVAKLVIEKMEANQGFPTISRAELDSLHITLQH